MSKSLGKYGDVSGLKSIPGSRYGMNFGGSGSSLDLERNILCLFIPHKPNKTKSPNNEKSMINRDSTTVLTSRLLVRTESLTRLDE